jgi:hypothetical protein
MCPLAHDRQVSPVSGVDRGSVGDHALGLLGFISTTAKLHRVAETDDLHLLPSETDTLDYDARDRLHWDHLAVGLSDV